MWYYVYILKCKNSKLYYGCTVNFKERFARHQKGYVPSTKNIRPLELVCCMAFANRYKAYTFEKYLKSGSGRAFVKKHFL